MNWFMSFFVSNQWNCKSTTWSIKQLGNFSNRIVRLIISKICVSNIFCLFSTLHILPIYFVFCFFNYLLLRVLHRSSSSPINFFQSTHAPPTSTIRPFPPMHIESNYIRYILVVVEGNWFSWVEVKTLKAENKTLYPWFKISCSDLT